MYSQHHNRSICGWNRKLSLGAGVRFSHGTGPRPLGRGPSCWEKESHSPVICDSLRTHRLPAMCRLHNSAWRLPTIFGLGSLTGFHLATVSHFSRTLHVLMKKNWATFSQLGKRHGEWQWSRIVITELTIIIKNAEQPSVVHSHVDWKRKMSVLKIGQLFILTKSWSCATICGSRSKALMVTEGTLPME